MMKKDELCFVQFIHPAGEHEPEGGNLKAWNRSVHRRKFLVNKGFYLSDTRDIKVEAELGFWGEWEPESQVEDIAEPVPGGPHYIHRPYYVKPKSYQGLQNTDPFVFGEQFLYTICQQNTVKWPTQLRNLAKGSVVLFGSGMDRKFVLDTVFVVDDWIDHSKTSFETDLRGRISETFRTVTIMPMYYARDVERSHVLLDNTKSFRLYFGATFDKPFHTMYSFFPARPYNCYPNGFARPTIKIDGIITNSLSRGKKLNRLDDLEDVRRLWNNVVQQVLRKGLKLGVSAELPKERNN